MITLEKFISASKVSLDKFEEYMKECNTHATLAKDHPLEVESDCEFLALYAEYWEKFGQAEYDAIIEGE